MGWIEEGMGWKEAASEILPPAIGDRDASPIATFEVSLSPSASPLSLSLALSLSFLFNLSFSRQCISVSPSLLPSFPLLPTCLGIPVSREKLTFLLSLPSSPSSPSSLPRFPPPSPRFTSPPRYSAVRRTLPASIPPSASDNPSSCQWWTAWRPAMTSEDRSQRRLSAILLCSTAPLLRPASHLEPLTGLLQRYRPPKSRHSAQNRASKAHYRP